MTWPPQVGPMGPALNTIQTTPTLSAPVNLHDWRSSSATAFPSTTTPVRPEAQQRMQQHLEIPVQDENESKCICTKVVTMFECVKFMKEYREEMECDIERNPSEKDKFRDIFTLTRVTSQNTRK